jgi:GT2 family glycosyltransferase
VERIANDPLVSVIIVNWNRLDDILSSIRILSRSAGIGVEIIVVDNGSTDGSPEALARNRAIRLIPLAENLGPATARNLAIDEARGRFLFFLDSDATITVRALRRLVDRMDRDPTIGVIGCRIVNYTTRETDQWIYAESEKSHSRREFDTYSFSAAGALVRAGAIAKAGRFWDDLFIYNEETDLSIRILKAGYRIIYSPEAEVYHNPSDGGRVVPGLYWFYQARNHIWIFFRYYPFPLRWMKVLVYIPIYIVKSASNWHLSSCISGIASGLGRHRIIGDFREKLTFEECRRLESLNRRSTLRLGR